MQPSSSKSTGPTSPDTETYTSAESTTWNQLTLLRGDFPARTCPSRGNDRGLRENAPPSGESSPESLASLGPDGLWLRMYQGCFQVMMDGSLETFSGTWPRSGTMRNGTVYQRQPLVPLTDVTGCSLLPTPTAREWGSNTYMRERGLTRMDCYRMWPTPRAANPGSRITSKGGKVLAQEVEIAEGIRNPLTRERWPTPRAQARAACFVRDGGNRSNLEEIVGERGSIGQLNPTWVEWLMGFPTGWTDCDASETP